MTVETEFPFARPHNTPPPFEHVLGVWRTAWGIPPFRQRLASGAPSAELAVERTSLTFANRGEVGTPPIWYEDVWPRSPVGQPGRSRRPDRTCSGATASAPASKNSTGIDPPPLRISGYGRPHEDPRQGVDDILQPQSGWARPKRMCLNDPATGGGRGGALWTAFGVGLRRPA